MLFRTAENSNRRLAKKRPPHRMLSFRYSRRMPNTMMPPRMGNPKFQISPIQLLSTDNFTSLSFSPSYSTCHTLLFRSGACMPLPAYNTFSLIFVSLSQVLFSSWFYFLFLPFLRHAVPELITVCPGLFFPACLNRLFLCF